MYDPYWSVKPMVIPVYLAMLGMEEFGEISLRGYLIIGLSWFYGIRLTFNFLRGWPGLDHEDWRYVNFRKQFPKLYWLVSFSGIHLFPTLMVYLGCLPMYPAIIEPVNAFGILDVLAAIFTFAAVMIELVADEQMRNFAKTKKPGEIMTKGLWAYSRHPNYFGEIMFWWGLLLFGIAANPDFWWTGVGALAITIMFYAASIPMIDKRSLERRPGYAEHIKNTSAIIPWKKT
jgi:steroid 5-alpha reductase family enzyme